MKSTLTTFNIADFCEVTHRTVQHWIASGKLIAYKTPGNHSRVKVEDLINFMKKYNMPIPPALEVYLRRKKRLLIVDDDESMVFVIKGTLEADKRYEIEEAYDGFVAGKKFAEFRPDLVTLDINMPKLDGFDVCKEIRKDPLNKDVKIVVISGINNEKEKKHLKDLGADAFIGKPFERKELISTIEELLGVNQEV